MLNILKTWQKYVLYYIHIVPQRPLTNNRCCCVFVFAGMYTNLDIHIYMSSSNGFYHPTIALSVLLLVSIWDNSKLLVFDRTFITPAGGQKRFCFPGLFIMLSYNTHYLIWGDGECKVPSWVRGGGYKRVNWWERAWIASFFFFFFYTNLNEIAGDPPCTPYYSAPTLPWRGFHFNFGECSIIPHWETQNVFTEKALLRVCTMPMSVNLWLKFGPKHGFNVVFMQHYSCLWFFFFPPFFLKLHVHSPLLVTSFQCFTWHSAWHQSLSKDPHK